MAINTMFKHLSGLPNIPEENYFLLETNETTLFLNHVIIKLTKNIPIQTFEIALERILDSSFIDEEYLKDKSVIKRAIVGGLIGPVAAIVGGLSGIGKKTKIKKLYAIIFLNSSDEIKTIVFDPSPIAGGMSLAQNFHKKITKDLEAVEKVDKIKEIMKNEMVSTINDEGTEIIKL